MYALYRSSPALSDDARVGSVAFMVMRTTLRRGLLFMAMAAIQIISQSQFNNVYILKSHQKISVILKNTDSNFIQNRARNHMFGKQRPGAAQLLSPIAALFSGSEYDAGKDRERS